ncbi:MAG: histidine phosphatase family protein [Pseudomonadota bacterium]|nr:histidine phosphatase family protein [Pseudomonadota bacterium]
MEIEGATLVTVLRHGAVAGRPHVYRGNSDAGMTPLGVQQVREAAGRVATPPFDRVASSPYRRCLDFARAYADELGAPLEVIESLREMAFGAWEGMTPAEAAAMDPEMHALFRASAGSVAPPGGETLMQLQTRVGAGWDAWLHNSPGGHRLLVTHAGVMRVLLMQLLGMPHTHAYRIALPEAACFRVSILAGEAPVLLSLNACAA